jgi:HPt (histidine-containing phosphotransfer) domain-containing protein
LCCTISKGLDLAMQDIKAKSEAMAASASHGSLLAAPVDLQHLRRYTLGNQALEAEILRLFQSQLPETLAALRAAATQRDWKIAAHTLKGSSRAIGAWQIADLAEGAERLACETEPHACLAAISRLEKAASDAHAFIEEACRLAQSVSA